MSGARLTVLVVAVAALSAGCGGLPFGRPAQSGPQLTTAPASPAGPAVAPLAAWQQKGATAAPPASVVNVTLAGVSVENQTGGQVSDADARAWALAIRRTFSYAAWAVAAMQPGFLAHSGLSDAPERVFASNLVAIGRAQAAGAPQVAVTPITIRSLVLRSVPAPLRGTFTSGGFTWAPYAFYVAELGPYSATVTDRQGRTLAVDGPIATGAGAAELVGGRLSDDPVLGSVWVAGSDWDCSTAGSRAAFGSLCSAP